MKKIFISIIFISLFFAPGASAHILKSEGSIGVLLHLSPDDDPIVGEPANFFFEIKDKDNKFQPADCICKISIQSNYTEVFSGDLFIANDSNDINAAVFSYTFPAKAIYNIIVSGQPKTAGGFQTFHVEYDVRVERTQMSNAGNSSSWLIIGIFAVLALIIFCGLYFKKN